MLYESEIEDVAVTFYLGSAFLPILDRDLDALEHFVGSTNLDFYEKDLRRIRTSTYPLFCRKFGELPEEAKKLSFLKDLKKQLDEKMELVTI